MTSASPPQFPAFRIDNVIQLARCADWSALESWLEAQVDPTNPALERNDLLLCQLLVTGELSGSDSSEAAIDTNALADGWRDVESVAQRLQDIAANLAFTRQPFAQTVLQIATALAPRSASAWLSLAWHWYTHNERDQAIKAARTAQQCSANSQDLGSACAALGWFYLEQGQLDAAEAAMLSALQTSPNHAALQWQAGNLQLRKKDTVRATHHLMAALELDPSLDEAAATLAWALHDQGHLLQASIWARRALNQRASPQRQAQLAWLLLLQGKALDAIPLFQQSLVGAPDVETTYMHLARAFTETRRPEEARQTLELGLKQLPDAPALLLAMGWLHHDLKEHNQAASLAQQVIQLEPESASAWHLSGVAKVIVGPAFEAISHLVYALRLDPKNIDAALKLAIQLQRDGKLNEAAIVVDDAYLHHPQDAELRALRVHIALNRSDTTLARQEIHALLAKAPADANLWYLLAQCLLQQQRKTLATRALRRALRLDPSHAQAWKLSAWFAIEQKHLAEAHVAIARWQALSPDAQDGDIQAAFALAECGDLAQAGAHAERAVARDGQSAEAWRALTRVRQLQGRLVEAEYCVRQALDRQPEHATECLRQLGWILRSFGRCDEAVAAFQAAVNADPGNPTCLYELAEALAGDGRTHEALEITSHAGHSGPVASLFKLLHAQLLVGLGSDHWGQATDLCASLLRQRACVEGAGTLLMTMAAQGHPQSAQALRQLPRARRVDLYCSALEAAQARASLGGFCAMALWAQQEFPEDARIAATAHYAYGLTPDVTAPQLARQARAWQRRLVALAGKDALTPNPPHLSAEPRLRIAYVAAHFHHTLLGPALATHDPSVVDVFLYCDLADKYRGELPNSVYLQPLRGQDLVASMHANRIDVAIDTVGVVGVLGQDHVLQQFARRVAPVQCGWLGSWASSAGVFDYLIADQQAVPDAALSDYEEDIVHIPGGQWSWRPPIHSPPIVPPPCLARGHITLGCPVRAFRISPQALAAWASLLVRLPDAELVLMGEHGANAAFRAELGRALAHAGVDSARMRFQAHRPYEDYLAGYNDIDIVLDSFPVNGGLCLLDALWMGVPFVSRPGHWLGERQGLSILAAIGHTEWAVRDVAQYIDTVCSLANAPQALAAMRGTLRNEVAESSLLDGSRLARAIEATCLQLKQRATDVAQAVSAKERTRAVARHQLDMWLARGCRLTLASAPGEPTTPIDVSVVIVLFNQAGLSRQAFAALTDQTGVNFETVVVDNASSDATAQLLDRLDGVTILRNQENLGFLRAANQGAALARGRHILFLNNDAILHPLALAHGVRRLDADASVGAVGGRIVLGNGTLQEAGCMAYRNGSTVGYGRGQDPLLPEFCFVRDVDFCSGAFLMVRQDLWQNLGGFDPVFAPAYFEDTDLCLRIQDAGYRVVYDPSIWLTHFEWASASTQQEAPALMEGRRALFAERHHARLAQRPDPAQARPARDRCPGSQRARILMIDNAVPHMAAGGGLPRARLMVQALAGHHLTLFPLWEIDDDWRDVYASIPETVEVMLGVGAAGLERFLQERKGVYDFVVVSRPPNMDFVERLWSERPELFEGMRLVYDAEAIFAVRDIGQAAILGRPMPAETCERLVRAELALIQRADTVLSVSAHEADMFRAAGARHVELVSHAMETRANPPGWEGRDHLLFVGAIHPHTPNEDSLLWFCEHVAPILRGLLGIFIRIDIVGDCTSGKVVSLANEHVRLVGRVDDLTPWYDQHRVFIAPTRFGAGVPAKVIEAACNGIPVVATPLLVRQLGWQGGVEIATGEVAQAFAEALASLYRDASHWTAMQAAMRDRTRRLYAPEQFRNTLATVFATALRAPPQCDTPQAI